MSIQKIWILITFANMSQAMHMEKCCKMVGIEGNLIPTPRHISASCSISWRSLPQYRSMLLALLEREKIKPQGIHECVF